jgi:hypothetical protein
VVLAVSGISDIFKRGLQNELNIEIDREVEGK